ncbi:MAG TPA: FprA family A-type flavoprotein [Clostridia bacterium]|jgi:flavorubredoxin|nr:FprA family A-type flavoprotein [Clostridia bacterium]HPY43792.1 FprA family A-type flavoprotein [Clostridia bacterium]HQA98146.1 FprA family A-type flavoprotein [Clostridia bacterium]HQO56881.1 FprA family A-type flavoprotein [Clostridia bacterium]
MFEIKSGIYSVGVQNPDLEVFDIIMKTPRGTSYNAYLIRGSERTALVETAKEGFLEEYLANIGQIIPFEQVDYLIINHTEPDHAGIIPELLSRNGRLQLIGTHSAITFIGQIINRPFNSRAVKAGDALSLGDRTLRFYPMPNLHWPDTMFTHDSLSNGLFTCDFLGAHYSFAPLLMSKVRDIPDYMAGVEKYYQDIMSPFSRPFVVNGIKAVRDIGPDLVLPGHGAVLDSHLEQMLEMYERLSAAPEKSGKSVAMIYVSAYGYTRALARAIGQELEENGIAVRQIELDEHNKTQALEAVALADGVLFGSPTFLGDALQPIGELLAALHPYNVKGKLCAAFGSYGWSGEAVANITGRLEQLRARTMPGVRARLRPGAEELAEARAFAERFAKELS